MNRHLSRSPRLVLSLFIVLALSVGFWISCGENFQSPSSSQESQEVVLNPSDPQVRAVMDVQDRHTPDLMKQPGIIGTGTGMTKDGRPAIIVLAKDERLAKEAAIPPAIDDIPVEIMVIGEVRALGGPPGGGGGVDPTARFDRPVPIGVSTGHPAITAGTIGCRVTDGTNVFALSNNHVYAATNFEDCSPTADYDCAVGDPVIQPGSFDGGTTPDDDIGNVSDFEPILFDGSDNTIDAAIASTTTSLVGNSTPSDGYGTPKSGTGVAAFVNQQVKKYGRTTGQTSKKVSAINATVNVNYGDPGTATFVDQIVIRGGNFSAGGDSGSLIVQDGGADDAEPVGLLFAGSNSTTIANPIGLVLDRFNVTVDGQ